MAAVGKRGKTGGWPLPSKKGGIPYKVHVPGNAHQGLWFIDFYNEMLFPA